MYDAYSAIFHRCGLKTTVVEADTGVMGGKYSHEFMVPAETGENEIVFCENCSYAANVEKATSKVQRPNPKVQSPNSEIEKFPTPGVVTIEGLTRSPFNVP